MLDVGIGVAIGTFTLALLGVAYKVGRIEQSKIGRTEFNETLGRIHGRIDDLFALVKRNGNKS